MIEVKKEREEQIEVEDQQPHQTSDVLITEEKTTICLKTEKNFSEPCCASTVELVQRQQLLPEGNWNPLVGPGFS
ncbi:hypothetical protein E1301_Tti015436 [Triplophysa tibetana]|uniref:Uncharacterized protein n=1 Tax=Triplophysa tibetana TaxID=1572043 RepID=A0A5A9P9P2_9TELE|nr:hypothetical protein E1301_Tti015436 [Triplophysa tibetana]